MDYCEDSLRKSGILFGYFLGNKLTGKSTDTAIKKTAELAKGIKFKESLAKCADSKLKIM